MQPLAPEYLAELGRQIATLSAFLGGFAAAFYGTLLMADRSHRIAGWAAGSAAIAAAAFVVAVVAATMLVIALHPGAPRIGARGGQGGFERVVAAVTFFMGIYALLASLGLSGWLRSRRLGIATSLGALVAAGLVTAVTVSVGK